jgi:hypothetical protein
MTMTAEQQEFFRLAILKVLDSNKTRFGLSVPAIIHVLPMFGFPHAEAEAVLDEMEYLGRRELVTEVLKVVSKENRCWRITQVGIGFLDARS